MTSRPQASHLPSAASACKSLGRSVLHDHTHSTCRAQRLFRTMTRAIFGPGLWRWLPQRPRSEGQMPQNSHDPREQPRPGEIEFTGQPKNSIVLTEPCYIFVSFFYTLISTMLLCVKSYQ